MRRATDPVSYLRALEERPYDFDFYQVLRRLESLYPNKPRIGRALRPADEPVRLGQETSMSFAPAPLAAFIPATEGRPPRLQQRFFGLLGPNGPLPMHLTDFTRERILHGGDPTIARFLDLLNHRFLALFYRAWAQAQPTVSLDRPADDRFVAYVGSLLGIGTGTTTKRDAVGDYAKLFYSGLLVRQVRNRDGLAAWLAGFFRVPVRVDQFVGHWMRLPEQDRTRIGIDTEGARLGIGAVAGARVWDRQHKICIELGPLSLERYESFLPDGSAIGRLVAIVRQYLCLELQWDARLRLSKDQVPRIRLGRYGRLGWTTWLGAYRRAEDAADLTLEAERLVCAGRGVQTSCNHGAAALAA
jgi:type VI secretion system protein ImpH